MQPGYNVRSAYPHPPEPRSHRQKRRPVEHGNSRLRVLLLPFGGDWLYKHLFKTGHAAPEIPRPCMWRFQSTNSAISTRTFLGLHPRSAQVPPRGRESTMATFHPAERHYFATVDPATPAPITTRSNSRTMHSPWHYYPRLIDLPGVFHPPSKEVRTARRLCWSRTARLAPHQASSDGKSRPCRKKYRIWPDGHASAGSGPGVNGSAVPGYSARL